MNWALFLSSFILLPVAGSNSNSLQEEEQSQYDTPPEVIYEVQPEYPE